MEPASYRSIEKPLKELASEEIDAAHYTRTMARVREKIERNNPMTIAFRRAMIVTGVVAVLVISLLFIPATYNVQVGSLVTARFNMDGEDAIMEVLSAFNGMDGLVNTSMCMKEDDAELALAFKGDTDSKVIEARVKEALAPVLEENASIVILSKPIMQPRGGNALAAVTGGRVSIGVEDMSDGEIEAIIVNWLQSAGLMVKNIDVKTDMLDDGKVRMEVMVEADAPEDFEGELPDLPPLEGFLPCDACEDGQKIEIRRVIKKD